MILFSGLSAFPLTPTSAGGRLDKEAMVKLVRHAVRGGADSIGVLGSTGVYMYLSREQRRRAVRAAVKAAGSVPVIASVGALRTDEAVALAKDAADEGAAGLLLAPVSYTPLTNEEVYQHFAAVADASDRPICIYSNPTTTRFTFNPDLVGRLVRLPTVAAIKLPMPSGRTVAEDLALFRQAAPDLAIGYSGDWGIKDAFLAGANGFYSGAAGIFPAQTAALAKAARAGDREEAERLDAQLAALWGLARDVGGLRVFYAAANILGLTDAQPPRPILPLEGEMLRRVEAAVRAIEL